MDFLAEFRHPSRWYTKLIAVALVLVFFMLLAEGIIAGFVVYRIVAPTNSGVSMDPLHFPGHPQQVTYPVSGQGVGDGWFFPTQIGAHDSFVFRYQSQTKNCCPLLLRCKITSTMCFFSISNAADPKIPIRRSDFARPPKQKAVSRLWRNVMTWIARNLAFGGRIWPPMQLSHWPSLIPGCAPLSPNRYSTGHRI